MRAHRHDLAYVSVVLDGEYTELCDDIPERRPSGTVVVHRAGEEHADYFERDTRCLNFALHDGAITTAVVPMLQPHDEILRRMIVRIVHILRRADARVEALDSAVRAFLNQLVPNATRATGEHDPEWLRVAIERFNWVDPIPIERAASLSGVHPTHFSRAFRRHVGITPNAYRRRARVRLASQLLLGSTQGLSRIAQRCGFSDQSHFTHVFSQGTGVTPAQYRRIFTT